ncbi:MAG: hypothetical protein R3B40_11940 [Polyangiales bacterium]|nr:hypothetical protein [Myxococcales bacterium]MCB9657295.1 hypothetical protein [Sandaracinaceae bacterium]
MATRPALPVLWLAASLGLGALGARLPDAHGALPPAYGGTAVLPADGALVRPLPGDALTPLAAALESAVYDTLYTTDGNGRLVPLLAAEMPTRAGGELRITLREGLRVHGGASLTAAHVVESLDAARRGRHEWLLAGIPVVRARGPLELGLRTQLSAREVAHRLSASPLAIVVQQGVPRGTGPFVVDVQPNGHLRLRGTRFAARGAPYLRELQVVAARSSADELRAFELGELHAAFVGTRGSPEVQARTLSPVLLIPNRSRGALASAAVRAAVEGALDRARLERVGVVPGAQLGVSLPAWQHPGAASARAGGPLRILVAAEDPFERRVADALAAQLDARGFTVQVVGVGRRELAERVRGGVWELRLATLFPPLSGDRPLVAAAFAATGQNERARALAERTLRGDTDARSVDVAAWVLGGRQQVLYHRATLHGASFDALGRLRLDALHRPREVLGAGAPSKGRARTREQDAARAPTPRRARP